MSHHRGETPSAAFVRGDGKSLRVVSGFRARLLQRPATWPQDDWTDADYDGAAATLIERWRRKVADWAAWGVQLDGLRVLEIGCGAGLQSLLLGMSPVREVVSTDLRLRVLDPHASGDRSRRLAERILVQMDWRRGLQAAFADLPIRFRVADATRSTLPSASFDLVVSGSVLEHVKPLDAALSELARVLRPGGRMVHAIDPFYWLRGCHKAAMTDIPWAHARMSADEVGRFVRAHEGEERATAVFRKLTSLNQYTLEQYRDAFATAPVQVLQWREKHNPKAEEIVAEFPDVLDTLLPGVSPRDLVHGQINVLAAKRG